MRFLLAFPAVAGLVVPIALAAPSGNHAKQNVQKVDVMIQQIKGTSEMDIAVVSQETAQILGYACSNTLKSGAFADLPIIATVDKNGAGTLAVGPKTYNIHENPEISGGITCARIYNDAESFMNCAVPVPASLPLTPINNGGKKTCFNTAEIPTLQRAYNSILTQNDAPAMTNITEKLERLPQRKRQAPCGNWSPSTLMVGDGNPHQNYLNTQLSENMDCGAAPSCTVGEMQSTSYTIGWSASATAWEWLTGGFDVSVSWTTGNTYSCTGAAYDTVCVWYNTAHTAYTVQNAYYNDCTGDSPYGGDFVMFSPNNNNVGGGYYCVIGTCRDQGQNYWDYNGPAGGP